MMPLLVILLALSLTLIVAGFFLSARSVARNQRVETYNRQSIYSPGRQVRTDLTRYGMQPLPPRHTSMTPSTTARASAARQNLRGRQPLQSIPWKVVTIGLVSLVIIGLYCLNLLLPHHGVLGYYLFDTAPTANPVHQKPSSSLYHASQALVRISQLDSAQYNSSQEYNIWAYSACSAAAMMEVFNAYGRHYRVTDVLKVEARINEITPQLGLVEDSGIQRTAAQFGFKTFWGHQLSLDQVISTATHGKPVIVSFPPDRYDGGHILVVTGGDSQRVFLADTSLWNRHSLSRSQFLAWWEGFSAVVTPQ